jgi:predicted ATPase/DNA-binding CsgD family transcriptional regulator
MCAGDEADAWGVVWVVGAADNLPTQLTSLIGREEETAAVVSAMGESRLVTLVGTGGVGKTRLGLQVAAESIERFEGGVWWAEMATVGDAASVPAAVLRAIGVPVESGRRPVQLLADQIGEQATLFVLDNCEHVVGAVATLVEELLTMVPAASVLVTSREPLAVSGETVWRVPSLDVPDPSSIHTAESIENADASRLFMERARRARPDLELTDDGADAVARICLRLDGIPLSIELAAARSRNLGIEQIARELDDRFRLLTGGTRTALERQQTLKASLDWSHGLLDDTERAGLRRLGVFAGGFTIDAAEAVFGAFDPVDHFEVMDLLDRLADKSLITPDGTDETGESRYRLLETIRHYALDRLDDAGEVSAARDAHADYWGQWARDHSVYADCDLTLRETIPRNLANLSAAVRWARMNSRDLVCPLMLAAAPFLEAEDATGGGEGPFESALAVLEDHDEVAWASVAGAFAFARMLTFVEVPSEHHATERAETLAAKHDLPLVRASYEFTRAGMAARDASGYVEAGDLFDAAGTPTWALLSRALGARYYASWGHLPEANALLEQCRPAESDLVRIAAAGAEAQIAVVKGELANVASRARQELESIEASTSSARFIPKRLAYDAVARAAFFSGDHDVLAWAVQDLRAGATSRMARWVAAHASAYVDVVDGSPERARDRLQSALAVRLSVWEGKGRAGGLLRPEQVHLAVSAGDLEWIQEARVGMERFVTDGDLRLKCIVEFADAVVALTRGDDSSAKRQFRRLLEAASKHGYGFMWIDALEGLAICAAREGSNEDAARLAGATEIARENRAYRYHYPHLAELPDSTEGGRVLSLEEVTAYVLRDRSRRDRPVSGWAALTPAEVEVALTVAEGLTNKQTAERLFMSVPTVKTHLRHIYAKLEIDNRSQLAPVVADRDS